ncbi:MULTISPECIES: MerR family transcriptional regulator [unclassified Frankia]|uniref:MerR family transcriptional regulator n=1 Tax=unclassified Frankia TaxID=2632575 RepID=UPI0020245273
MSAVTPSPDPAEHNPRYTVAAVARRLGIAPATLRTWNRRYGLGPADHVSGTRRRYDPHDLARLEFMCRLTQAGIAPAEAARLARSALPEDLPEPQWPAPLRQVENETHSVVSSDRPGEPDTQEADQPRTGRPVVVAISSGDGRGAAGNVSAPAVITGPAAGAGMFPAADVDDLVTGAADPADDSAAAMAGPGRVTETGRVTEARGSGGRVLSLAGAGIAARGLARAAMALDSSAVTRILAQAVEADGVVAAWQDLACPVLVAVGRRWELRGDAVDVEHLLSECVAAVFRRVADRDVGAHARPVLLACTPDERHSLALNAVAAGLAERGIPARVLGAAVPAAALRTAVVRTGPAAVFLWSQRRASADVRVWRGLPTTRPSTSIVVGGPGWHRTIVAPRVRRAQSLPEALDLLTPSPG